MLRKDSRTFIDLVSSEDPRQTFITIMDAIPIIDALLGKEIGAS